MQLASLWLRFSPDATRFLTHPIQLIQRADAAPARAAKSAAFKLYSTYRTLGPYDRL